MNNPIIQKLSRSQLGQAKQMIDMIRAARNPEAMVEQMASKNPQMKQVVDMVKTGGNPQQMFMNACKQKGIDPESILSMMR